MTKPTDNTTLHELLVELAYDEIDPLDADAARTQLDEDSRQLLEAFRAVRADLRSVDQVEPAPSRITFVALTAPVRRASKLGRWTRGGAIAASFLMGLLLTAALANVRIGTGPDGWSFSTGLWSASNPPSPAVAPPTAAAPATATSLSATTPGRSATEADFDRWFDNKIRERSLSTGTTPVALSPEEVTQLMRERDSSLRQEYDSKLAGMFQVFDAQRNDDQLFIANEFGLWQEDTGVELERMNQAINYLISRVATDQRVPERRDD